MKSITDPSKHNVADVLAYAEKHPDEATALRKLEEKAARPRTTLIAGLKEINANAKSLPTAKTVAKAKAKAKPAPKPKAVKASAPHVELHEGDKDTSPEFANAGITPVADLQARLPGVAVTGRFGPTTLRRIRAIQAEAGLPVTGVVDAATASAI